MSGRRKATQTIIPHVQRVSNPGLGTTVFGDGADERNIPATRKINPKTGVGVFKNRLAYRATGRDAGKVVRRSWDPRGVRFRPATRCALAAGFGADANWENLAA